MKKTIIFDLDGTLVDIEPLFLDILNQMAQQFKFSPILPEERLSLKHLSLKQLVWQRLGWRIIFLPFLLERGRAEYKKRVSEVILFPGIPELLHDLKNRGYRLGIVSSSRQDTIEAIATRYALPVDFIASGRLFHKAKSLRATLKREGLNTEETLYVGDEVRDVEACHGANLDIIAVTWGLNSKEALTATGAPTVDTREELLALILAS